MFILFIIAGMIISFAIFLLITRIQYIRDGVAVEAIVDSIEIIKSNDSDAADTYNPIYKFYTLDNEEILATADKFGSDDSWLVGDKATIVYQKYNPQRIVLLTFWGSFGLAAVLFSVALVLILIAAGYYWAESFFNSF